MRQTIALIVSIVLGLVAVFAMKAHVTKVEMKAKEGLDLVKVAVVKRSMPSGGKVTPDTIRFKSIPAGYAAGMVTEDKFGQFSGRVLTRPKKTAEPVFLNDLIVASQKKSPIANGERIITLGVNQESGVAGLIRPKDRVDIVYTYTARVRTGGVSNAEKRTILLLSRVPVFAIDNKTEYKPSKKLSSTRAYSSITLIVSPEEAQLLVGAQQAGSLTFVLRNQNDPAVVTGTPTVSNATIEQVAAKLNTSRKKRQGGR